MIAPTALLERKGSIIFMSSSYEGRGYHSLMAETGAKLYSNYGDMVIWKAFVKKRNVFYFSPNVSESDLYHFFPENVTLIKKWDDLILELEKLHGTNPKACIVPTSIQLT